MRDPEIRNDLVREKPTFMTADIRRLFACLEDAGKQAYVVGGAVRDWVLGLPAHDIDMTTDAVPDEIERIFSAYHTISIGRAYGTIAIVTPDSGVVQITTFREDQTYSDSRHPDDVRFAKSLEEDLSRRDFTVNAMAYHPEKGLIDRFGGAQDAKDKWIRAVGDPDRRIEEDALRMLRAVRFAHRLQFDIDPPLKQAIMQHRENIRRVSQERITQELFEIFVQDPPSRGIRLLDEVGLLEILLPTVWRMKGFDQKTPYHHLDLYEHTLSCMDQTPAKRAVRIAALLHDIGKLETQTVDENGQAHYYGHDKKSVEMTHEIMRAWKTSNALAKEVELLIGRHMGTMNTYTKKSIRRLMRKVGPSIDDLLALQEADILSTKLHLGHDNLLEGRRLVQEIREEGAMVTQNALAVNGRDLIEIGYQQGKPIGAALRHLTDLVDDEKVENEKAALLEMAGQWLSDEEGWKDESPEGKRSGND